MSEEELDRMEVLNRSYLTRDRVRDVMKEAMVNREIDDEMVMIVATLTKDFLSELCDGGKIKYIYKNCCNYTSKFCPVAVDVMKEQNLEKPGIHPQHIRYYPTML